NFVSAICLTTTAGASSDLLSGVADYVLWFARARDRIKYRPLYRFKTAGDAGAVAYSSVEEPNGNRRRATAQDIGSRVRYLAYDNFTSQRPPGDFPIEFNGRVFRPGPGYWKTG